MRGRNILVLKGQSRFPGAKLLDKKFHVSMEFRRGQDFRAEEPPPIQRSTFCSSSRAVTALLNQTYAPFLRVAFFLCASLGSKTIRRR